MIPKKIHYCWFGGKGLPAKALGCIDSWRKFCPDYEIIQWNESNFDLQRYPYLSWCHQNGKWAFLSDFARLLIVYEYGGIYFDTDVEIIKSFDDLLNCSAFYGFENQNFIATGLAFGAEKQHVSVAKMVQIYENIAVDENGNFQLIGCPHLNTKALLSLGLKCNGEYQKLDNDICIYPPEYFNPLDDSTGVLRKTVNTHSIHWFAKSWISPMSVLRSKITRPFHRVFGENCFRWLKK